MLLTAATGFMADNTFALAIDVDIIEQSLFKVT